MTETVDSCGDARKRFTSPSRLPGAGQHLEKMQGHWVLARAGKRVLRPGGLALTRRMIDALSISVDDRVVEFAPGMGVTARMVLRKKPSQYWGVERDPAAAARLESLLPRGTAQIVGAQAEHSGLPNACASVAYGEAMLSMQTLEQKKRILSEARRLLALGGTGFMSYVSGPTASRSRCAARSRQRCRRRFTSECSRFVRANGSSCWSNRGSR
jgi:phospholipid N-methyltransferase